MSKYYAVKNGRTPGIYRSWDECKAQVTGYSNAIYKSFKSESDAKDFLRGANSNIVEEELPSAEGSSIVLANVSTSDGPLGSSCEEVHIYTDGSHKRSKNFLGIGAWCRYKDSEYSFSKTLSRDFLLTYGIDVIETPVSNCTCEFVIVAEILKKLSLIKPDRDSKIKIVFYCDYIGTANWINGDWQAKQTYIQKILKICRERIKLIKCEIAFRHVPGHQGFEGNEKADQLAGVGKEIDDFDRLMESIFR